MLRKFKVTYRALSKQRTVEIEAYSKYNAKQKFYRQYPVYEIIQIEEIEI